MVQGLIHGFIHGPPVVPRSVRDALQIQRKLPTFVATKPRLRRQPPTYIKGVSNGNYFRAKIPAKKNRLPDVPELPPTNPMPKSLSPPPTPTSLRASIQVEHYPRRLLAWLKANRAVLVLNFGSMCTLCGFMRSDVLELRSLALTGNICFILYVLQQSPILWASITWSSLFASVNTWKIMQILHERTAEVYMSEEQQKIFVNHFMSHGITPKQYERILNKAKKLHHKKGKILVRSGEKLEHVYLVTEGSTRALILGRFVTAASTNQDTKGDQKAGGDSGAWIGEMAFLDNLWELEEGKAHNGAKKKADVAIYTIKCDEDCSVLSWSHEDMADLMRMSPDLRSGLTRAMTSALVGKVVNLTVSRTQKGLPSWASWLSHWNSGDGAEVNLQSHSSQPRLAEDRGPSRNAPPPAVA